MKRAAQTVTWEGDPSAPLRRAMGALFELVVQEHEAGCLPGPDGYPSPATLPTVEVCRATWARFRTAWDELAEPWSSTVYLDERRRIEKDTGREFWTGAPR